MTYYHYYYWNYYLYFYYYHQSQQELAPWKTMYTQPFIFLILRGRRKKKSENRAGVTKNDARGDARSQPPWVAQHTLASTELYKPLHCLPPTIPQAASTSRWPKEPRHPRIPLAHPPALPLCLRPFTLCLNTSPFSCVSISLCLSICYLFFRVCLCMLCLSSIFLVLKCVPSFCCLSMCLFYLSTGLPVSLSVSWSSPPLCLTAWVCILVFYVCVSVSFRLSSSFSISWLLLFSPSPLLCQSVCLFPLLSVSVYFLSSQLLFFLHFLSLCHFFSFLFLMASWPFSAFLFHCCRIFFFFSVTKSTPTFWQVSSSPSLLIFFLRFPVFVLSVSLPRLQTSLILCFL